MQTHALGTTAAPPRPPRRVTSLCYAPASVAPEQVVVGHEDGSLRAWDSLRGACTRSHRKKAPEVSAVLVLDRWVVPGALLQEGSANGKLGVRGAK